ncbi:hypothetical protein D3C81_182770 [compost metagenome]
MARPAFEQSWKNITGNPAIDFKDKRYTFVNYNANGDVIAATAAGTAIGIIQEPNNINEPAQVMVHGVSFVLLGGTVAGGDEVEIGAGGEMVKATTGKVVGICAVGGVSGDIGSVLLK